MTRIFIPRDSSALALGADAIAEAIAAEAARRGVAIDVVRNGSRGLLYLEPLIEVETSAGRVGYANVEAADVASLFDAGFTEGNAHARHVGVVDEIPYLKKQQRLTFARIGITDPLSTEDYVAHGGIEGLKHALAMDGAAACDALIESGLRASLARTCKVSSAVSDTPVKTAPSALVVGSEVTRPNLPIAELSRRCAGCGWLSTICSASYPWSCRSWCPACPCSGPANR